MRSLGTVALTVVLSGACAAALLAQSSAGLPSPPTPAPGAAGPPGAAVSADYTIGPEDVLSVVFWRDKELSADVTVRPDGKITLPLLNDVQAAGLTPDELRRTVIEGAQRFFEEPSAMVVVKQVNSRKVFITGQVEKPGPYALTSPLNVMQLIAMAGGIKEFSNGKKILIMRSENGRPVAYPFDYESVAKRKNLRQNIELKPGDTVIVP
jgi:polysaccharide export outer membrane protein